MSNQFTSSTSEITSPGKHQHYNPIASESNWSFGWGGNSERPLSAKSNSIMM